MKNFRFKTKTSVIKTLKEPPRPQRKINWQKWSWIGIIVSAVLFSGFRIFDKVTLVKGLGQVELSKQVVGFTDDIRLGAILVTEGQHVCIGDTLFFYQYDYYDGEMAARLPSTAKKPIDWLERERLNLKKQISLKNIEKENLSTRIRFKEEELKHQQDLVLLGVNEIEATLTKIEAEILKLNTQAKILHEEIHFLKQHLSRLYREEEKIRNAGIATQIAGGHIDGNTIPYLALIDGFVGNINFSPNEVCYEKQDVMTIHQKEDISIRAFFDPELVGYLYLDDIMKIKFPDGTQGQGRISNIYISTKELPVEFQKKYEPIERNVVVDIQPLNEEEEIRWIDFYKMNVDVSKSKW